MKIYINGEYFPEDEAKISVFDHGLLYGDGVFEGIRAYDGKIFKLDEHVDRLYESARAINLEIPILPAQMTEDITKTLRINGLTDGYIRVVITRGVGTLGLNPYKCHQPQVIIIADSISLYPPELYETGLEIVTVATRRNLSESLSPRVKSLNYLNNILAKMEGLNAGCEEAIMLNSYGMIAECTGDNIFIIKNGDLLTPAPSMGILEGVTRNVVIDLARERGYKVKETTLTRHDLFVADECFLTGTAAEVIPVIKIDGRPVGSGKPGPITQKLIAAFRAYAAGS